MRRHAVQHAAQYAVASAAAGGGSTPLSFGGGGSSAPLAEAGSGRSGEARRPSGERARRPSAREARYAPHPLRKEAPGERRALLHTSLVGGADEEDSLAESLHTLCSGQDELKRKLLDLEAGQDKILKAIRSAGQGARSVGLGSSSGEGTPRGGEVMLATGTDASYGVVSAHRSAESAGEPVGTHVSRVMLTMRKQSDDEGGAATCKLPQTSYCGFLIRPSLEAMGGDGQASCKLGDVDAVRVSRSSNIWQAISTNSWKNKSSQMSRLLPRIAPIHPDSVVRLCLDLTSMAVLLFDSASVPYQLSFDPQTENGFWFVTNWLTLAFWTADLMMGFGTGHYDKGQVVLSFRRIAWRYLQTFFWIDAFTVGCDWLVMVLPIFLASEGSGTNRHATIVKLFRILKLNRLIRFIGAMQSGKVGQMYDRIINWARQLGMDHQLQFVFNVVYLTFLILWLNHIGCCLWFAIQSEALLNWETQSNIHDISPGVESTAEWKYFLCFYWAMTSMVSGASIMSPTSLSELTFTICYVLFGLLVGSTLVSSLAAMLLDLQMSNKDRKDNVRLMRQYLYQQGLEVGLTVAVEREVVDRIWHEKRLGAKDVDCLRLLSPAMRSALNYAIYCKPLKRHAFLGTCHVLDRAGVFTRELCEEAVEHHIRGPGAQVFMYGQGCGGPLYVVIGRFDYRVKEGDVPDALTVQRTRSRFRFAPSSSAGSATPGIIGSAPSRSALVEYSAVVEPGEWLCELALWLQWEHRGSLDACLPCEYFLLKAVLVLRTLALFEDLRAVARLYAVALCSAAETEESQQLSDLPMGEELHQSVVISMPTEGRRTMSIAALRLLQSEKSLPFGRASVRRLVEQVDQGKCDLVIVRGQVLRVVSVVTLRLEREAAAEDGQAVRQVLAQLGKSTSAGDFENATMCQLPGGKVLSGEKPSDALARLLDGPLVGLRQAGLRQEELQRADTTAELVSAAASGAREICVSSLADMNVGSSILIEGEGPFGQLSETRSVVAIDVQHFCIQLDKPLKYDYAATSRVTKVRSKRSAEYGVETKYIRNVYCGELEDASAIEAAQPLHRPGRRGLPAGPSGRSGPTDYPAFLLPGPGRSAPSPDDAGGEAPEREGQDGLLCAWVDEADFAVLSSPAGAELVRAWVSELRRGTATRGGRQRGRTTTESDSEEGDNEDGARRRGRTATEESGVGL